MIISQISALITALRWLTSLIGLSLALLAVGLICMTTMSRQANTVRLKHVEYPIQAVKPVAVLTPALKKGKLLFATNCQACHEISAVRVVGPGLLGVLERVPDRSWLTKWIRSPSAVIQSGEVYANHMVKAFTPVLMPGFSSLTDTDIEALIDYIDSYKSNATVFAQ